MHKSIFIFVILSLVLLFTVQKTHAQYIIHEADESSPPRTRTIIVPYIFSSETLGLGLGAGGSYTPESAPQTMFYGTGYFTDNKSWLTALGGYNLNIPFAERIYIRPYMCLTGQTHKRIYAGYNNPNDPTERAGSNGSDKDNYLEEDALEVTFDLPIRFILPWGHYRDQPIHTYITENGLLKEKPGGATSINPLSSGKSTILFRPFYRKIHADVDDLETLFFELGYEHDNRDYVPNPHRGYKWDFSIQHDFDWLGDTRKWTSLDGEITGFIPLWDASWSRQQTLALSCWSAYSPTYNPDNDDIEGKPPYFTGPTLGGLWRMKGYPSNRFHDKTAIHYAAEYRIMPEWQPFGSIKKLDPLMIRWWQFVVLAEVGRVAPEWDIETLHTDMKYNVGFGIRGMFDKGIGRLDIVVSEEQTSIVAMLGQTF